MSKDNDITTINKNDLYASAGKSIFGAMPFIGPLLSEIVDNLIPNQRIDRISKYVAALEKRLSSFEEKDLRKSLQNEERLSLLEDGFIYAARALSDERRAYIASLVTNGITDEEIEIEASKYLLNLLAELNDPEIIWLKYYLRPGGDRVLQEKHSNVLKPIHAYMGAPDNVQDKSSLQKSYSEHLERLGLIKANYRTDSNFGTPVFDEWSGKPEVSYREITHLGKMLLKHIDLLDS